MLLDLFPLDLGHLLDHEGHRAGVVTSVQVKVGIHHVLAGTVVHRNLLAALETFEFVFLQGEHVVGLSAELCKFTQQFLQFTVQLHVQLL